MTLNLHTDNDYPADYGEAVRMFIPFMSENPLGPSTATVEAIVGGSVTVTTGSAGLLCLSREDVMYLYRITDDRG